MTELKLVSTKISDELTKKLDEYTQSTGLTRSAIVRNALEQYLRLERVDAVDSVDALRSEIDAVKARLIALEGLTTVDQSSTLQAPSPKPIAAVTKSSTPKPPIAGAVTGFMRTGELLTALKARGYTRSMSSLLRALNQAIETQAVPDELASFGVNCDFELKRSANRWSGSVKWLSIED